MQHCYLREKQKVKAEATGAHVLLIMMITAAKKNKGCPEPLDPLMMGRLSQLEVSWSLMQSKCTKSL